MSLGADGRTILCDGAACTEQTFVPVALPALGTARRRNDSAANWLYVRLNGVWQHYCPKCATAYHLANSEDTDPIVRSSESDRR